MSRPIPTLENLISRTSPEPNTGCWLWTGSLDEKGYARVGYLYKNMQVHRLIIIFSGIVIPLGMQVDHLCRVKCCINPLHLEVVTPKVNVHRSNNRAGMNIRKMHCIKGHSFDETNTYLVPKGRHCKACKIERQRVYRSKEAA